jgi:phospholipid/cholesterol/gamma-HCH transport system substrate-binding protein
VKVRIAALGAAALALSGCSFSGVSSLPLPGGPDTGSNPYSVKIDFENVLDLVPQSTCKVNDVSVGKVTSVKLTQWHAVVTCRLRRDAKLPANAVATIGQTSLLGEKYVSLSAPTAGSTGELKNGDEIPLSRTSRSTEIEEVLSALSMLLNGGGIEQISTITHELNAAMKGRTDTIRDVLNQVNTFTTTLDKQKSQIIRAIDSIDRLTAKLSDQRQTIADTIDKTGPAIKILRDNRADLTKMLVSLGKLGDTTSNVIVKSRDDLLTNLKNLQPILNNANKAGANLPRGLEMLLSYPFPPTYANAQRGDYANIHITVDLDLTNLLHNLLGGTALDKTLSQQSAQLRSQLKPPQITVSQSPPGVLSQTSLTPGTSSTPSATKSPAVGMAPAGTDSGLYRLMTEGLT